MSTIQNPFPGLRPFGSTESHLFFGRERHISEILRKLELFRFVSIVGNSGSGKSSLVKAGVLPTLFKNDQDWIICVMRPGKNPIEQLSEAIFNNKNLSIKGTEKDLNKSDGFEILRNNELGVVQLLRKAIPDGKRLLILVDQFEELFRFNTIYQNDEEFDIASHFVNLLLGATGQKDVPIYSMITLRSDFLGDCEQFMGLPEAINDGQFLIPRMNREDLNQSLTGPVRVAKGKITPRLVQQLLNEIGNNPDQLPILQHVLMRSWEVWQDEGTTQNPMDLSHYESTGGMKMALSNHAEEAYSELKTKRREDVAEVLFKTITVKGTDKRGIRRPTPVHAIAKIAEVEPSLIIEVANIFRKGERGFIMPPDGVKLDENSILDISHESLMRVWERLKGWVQEEADAADLYHRIAESALLYEDEKAGLWRDPDLQIAVDWRTKNTPNAAWAAQYNPHFAPAMRFIQASENEKQFVLADKARRRRITQTALVGFLLALSALSIWAVTERNNSAKNATAAIEEKHEADKQKKVAEEQTVLAESNYQKAKEEEKKAQQQQLETAKQRELALQKAEEARIAKQIAESESGKAIAAKKSAEKDRQIAENQKIISDSLRFVSEKSEKKATRLRLLALAQNLAIKSKLADKNTYTQQVKALLALQAHKFNTKYEGNAMDSEIFDALFSAMRVYQSPSDYVFKQHSDEVKSLAFSDANGDLASTGADGKVVIRDSGKQSRVFVDKDRRIYDNLVYNSNGSQIALSCDDHSIQVFNSNNITKPSLNLKDLHPNKIISIDWYNNYIVTACLDTIIRVIDPASGSVIKSFKAEAKPLCIDIHEESNTLVLGCANGAIYKMNLKSDSGLELLTRISDKNVQVKCVALNKDATLVAAGTGTGRCYILSRSNGNTIANLSGHNAPLQHLRFHPNNNYLATSCLDNKVRLYTSLTQGIQPIVFAEHSSWALDVAFHPSEDMLASCSKDKTVRMYPISAADIASFLKMKINRNFTQEEWKSYIGEDVEYEKINADLP